MRRTLVAVGCLCLGLSAGWSTFASAADRHMVQLRRMNEQEYRRSIADIFGPQISFAGMFEPDLRRRTWGGFLSAMTLMVGSFAATTFVPSWIAQLSAPGGPAVIARDVSYFAMLLNVGAIIGYLVLIWLTASRIGRRGSYFVFALGALLTAIVMFTLVRSTSGVLVAAPIAGFFMLGGFGVFAVYLPELFPTAVRATGQGFCFNFARVITGVGTVTTGYLVGSLGSFPMAGLIVSLVFGIGLFTIWIGPETRTWGLRDY